MLCRLCPITRDATLRTPSFSLCLNRLIKLFVFVFAPEAAIDPFGLGQG